MITEPSATSRDYLRKKASIEADLRRALKGTTKRQRREAVTRAATSRPQYVLNRQTGEVGK